MNATKKILEIAKGYLGEQEIQGNLGFQNEKFEEKMIAVGWKAPWPWCAFFVELVWREAYAQMNSVIEAHLRDLITPSVTGTYNNFRSSKEYKNYVSNKPEKGSLIVFRYGSGWQGHIGIVEEIKGKEMICIEGNTNSSGGREGIEVARIRRLLNFEYKEKGLNLLGFVHPIDPLEHG